jgi:hypothetical protein
MAVLGLGHGVGSQMGSIGEHPQYEEHQDDGDQRGDQGDQRRRQSPRPRRAVRTLSPAAFPTLLTI